MPYPAFSILAMGRNVVHKPCAEPGCVTLAVFNQPGAGHGLYCGQHKPAGYVNVKVVPRSTPAHIAQQMRFYKAVQGRRAWAFAYELSRPICRHHV